MAENDQQQPNSTEKALATKGTLRWFLEDLESPYMARLRRLLGDRMPQFGASLLNLAHSSRQFENVRPQSIITAGIIAVTLDLPIDRNLGFAWIIPYGELAQFQIGYKGFVQLALRSGAYAGMNAKVINAEAFGGYDSIGDPIILWDQIDETKEAVGYAFAWKLTTGFTKVVYWPKKKVEAHALRYSQAYRQQKKDSPWFTNFDQMALKTVIKASLGKWGIMSVESRMQVAFERDQSAAIDVDATPIYPDADDNNGGAAAGAPAEQSDTPPVSNLNDLTDQLNQQQASRQESPVDVGQPAPAPPPTPATGQADVLDQARELLTDDQAPTLKLVPEPEKTQLTFEQMRERLAKAAHVSDVRALLLLWAGSKVDRSEGDKAAIKQLCDARIEQIKAASRKGNGEK